MAKPREPSSRPLVYLFGTDTLRGGKSDGNAGMKDLLGGKGANLAEMANLGLPVPPGFTLSTEVCVAYYASGRTLPDGLEREVAEAIGKVEAAVGAGFGDVANPLLVAVRSGARASMPGMMDTILNLGLNDETVEGLAARSGDRRFAYDSYRRFIQMFGAVVLATGSFALREVNQYSAERSRELHANAVIFAATISGPVRAGDKRRTLEALRAIGDLPHIDHIRVARPGGDIFVELGGAVEVLSGEWSEAIFAISRWPSREAALAFWNAPKYQNDAIPLRLDIGRFSVLMLTGEANNG